MHKLLIVAALLLSTAAAQEVDPTRLQDRSPEGAITWTGPFDSESPADVWTGGTLIQAINATNINAGSAIANGVVFSNSAELLSNSTDEYLLNRGTTRDPGYDKILGTVDFGNGPDKTSLVIGEGLLTPGNGYLVQVWWTDARTCCNNPRQMSFGDDLGNSVTLSSYGKNRLGQHVVGWFTAVDKSHTLVLDTIGNFNNAHLSAYQIREVSLNEFEAMVKLHSPADLSAEAAVQSHVETLTAGILAGSLRPGHANGFRTAVSFDGPKAIAADSAGNVFVADGHVVRKIAPDGRAINFAGSSNGYADGPGITARFGQILGLAIDSDDNIFVADAYTRRIRKITPSGYVTTLAGSTSGYRDGTGADAQFTLPRSIAVDGAGNVYVGDDKINKIRKITPDGIVTTIAGYEKVVIEQTESPGAGCSALNDLKSAEPKTDVSVRFVNESQNQVHVNWIDYGGKEVLYKTLPSGETYNQSTYYSHIWVVRDDNGQCLRRFEPGTAIQFKQPRGLAVDASANVIVLDGSTLKRIAPDGSVQMMAADRTFSSAANEDNRATFGGGGGVTVDDAGNIYVTSTRDKNLVMIQPDGAQTTIAWKGGARWIGQPNDVALGANGNFYFSDSHNHLVHQLTTAGNVGPLPGISIPKAPAPEPPAAAQTMSREQALALLKSTKKLAKDDLDALFELGKMYEEGLTGRMDSMRASSTYKKGAKKGHAGAQFEHGLRHLDGTISYGLTVVNGDVAAGKAKQLAKRQVAAADWYTRSADQGYAPAQYGLAWLYFMGHGVEKNSERAIELLTLAAEQGFFDAQFELAEYYRKGEGVDVDLLQALEWYSRAGEQGDVYSTIMTNALIEATAPSDSIEQAYVDAHAQTALALQLHAGIEVERDFMRATELFYEPAILGDTIAQRTLALMYLNGEGGPYDPEGAANWFNVAAQLGDADAQFWSGYLYERGLGVPQAFDRATYWYELAAQQGNLLAQMSLGYLYYADNNVGIDHAVSRDWYSKAAAQGDAQAQYNAGWLHLSNRDDTQSVTKAAALFENAMAQGHLEATRMAAVMERAVDGDAVAEYELGRKFEYGRGTPKSPYDALFWYTKSAEQGYAAGQFELGMMTRYRVGEIPQDVTASAAWLQVAADAGHVEAGVELEKLKADIQRQEDRAVDEMFDSIERLVDAIKNRDK